MPQYRKKPVVIEAVQFRSGIDECCCGHIRDEHDRAGPCMVRECRCVHFEKNPNAPAWQDDAETGMSL